MDMLILITKFSKYWNILKDTCKTALLVSSMFSNIIALSVTSNNRKIYLYEDTAMI